ncbi:MAG TPA: dienelactone hydrolase family protein [Steroidobacteraceae bacterium]|nr:dienelactone hydrolase family protein [Steroidobacteraceae bacterium]
MGELTTIMARDGHEFQAYLCAPPGRPRGAVVVIQEIFGVNSHIRDVADSFAAQGYTVIAPSLFDRIRRGIELSYTDESLELGVGYRKQLELDDTLKDLAAACAVVRRSGRIGTVGYCWGGALSYLCASELPIACAVVYYGKVADHLARKPRCPVMYHFGTKDKGIPLSDVERVRAERPEGTFHLYEAGHGFSCDQRPSYEPQSAALARKRTDEFFARYLAGEGAES